MNRRAFLQHLAGALVAINVTLGYDSLKAPKVVLEPLYPANEYRVVMPMWADGDIIRGCFVTRDGEKVRRATVSDRIFGIAEESVRHGQRVFVCVSGVANTTWAKQ